MKQTWESQWLEKCSVGSVVPAMYVVKDNSSWNITSELGRTNNYKKLMWLFKQMSAVLEQFD